MAKTFARDAADEKRGVLSDLSLRIQPHLVHELEQRHAAYVDSRERLERFINMPRTRGAGRRIARAELQLERAAAAMLHAAVAVGSRSAPEDA